MNHPSGRLHPVIFLVGFAFFCPLQAQAELTIEAPDGETVVSDEIVQKGGLVFKPQRLSTAFATPGIWGVAGGHAMEDGEFLLTMGGRYAQNSAVITAGDFTSWSGLTVNLAWSPLPILELGLGARAISVYNSQHNPQELLVLGDPEFSLRGAYQVLPELGLALQGRLRFPTGTGSTLLDFSSIKADIRLAASYVIVEALGLHLNAGVVVDNSAGLTEVAPDTVQRFAGDLADGLTIATGFGTDYSIRFNNDEMAFTPFVTFNALIHPDAPSFDNNVLWVSAGVGFTAEAFEIGLGADIRLSGAPENQSPLPGMMPFLVGLNMAYHFNVEREPAVRLITRVRGGEGGPGVPPPEPAVKEVVKEVVAPTWTISGRVLDATSKKPVPRGEVKVKNLDTSPLSVHREQGTFTTFGLESEKPVVLAVSAPGYLPREKPVAPLKEGQTQVVIELQRAGKATGIVRGSIKTKRGKPAKAKIFIPSLRKTLKTDRRTGTFSGELPAGTHEVVITARGARMQKHVIEIRPGDVVILNIDLK